MGEWGVVGDIAGWMAAGALLIVLVWAAIERGRRHDRAALRRGLRKDAAAVLARGFDRQSHSRLLRAARHAWRAHLA